MNLKTSPPKPVVPAIVGAVLLSAAVFSAVAQPAGVTDFTPFQLISQRNIFDPNRVPHVRSSSAHATARDNAALLRTLNQLRAADGVTDLKVDQIRGKAPMQFTFDFHWNKGGVNEN